MILQKKDKITMASEVLRENKEINGTYSLKFKSDIWGIIFMEFLSIDLADEEYKENPRILIGFENPIDNVYMWTKVVEDFPLYIRDWFDDSYLIGENFIYNLFERNLPLNFKYIYKNNTIIKTKDGWKINDNEFPLLKSCINFIDTTKLNKVS